MLQNILPFIVFALVVLITCLIMRKKPEKTATRDDVPSTPREPTFDPNDRR